jgi:hypothetical protein
MRMDYYIDYQYMPKGASRPRDDGSVVQIEATSEGGFAIIPNLGDFVHIVKASADDLSFRGKVPSRVFHYVRIGESHVNCAVNIVVEETDDDWGKLIKELKPRRLSPNHNKESRMVQSTNPQKLLRIAEKYQEKVDKLEKRVKALEEYIRRLRNAAKAKGIDGLPMPPWDA